MKWSIVINKDDKNSFNYLYETLNKQIINENLIEEIEIVLNGQIRGKWVSYINDNMEFPYDFIKKIYKYLILEYNKIKFNILNIKNNSIINIDKCYPIKVDINNNDINEFLIEDLFVFCDGFINDNNGYSIIVTAYNSQDFIEECLDSIKNQTYFKNKNNFEILLGIDGCEKTLKKVKEIKDKYRNLKVLMMDNNMGTYVTTNTLIKQSKYDNILRFDSDDIMKSNMIYEINKYINDYDIIRFKYTNFNKSIDNVYGNSLAHGIVLYKKIVFEMAGGFMDWKCGADTEFIERVKNYFNILELNEILFYRRQHINSLTNNKKTNFESQLRKKYQDMIGKHKYVWINKKTNMFTEI